MVSATATFDGFSAVKKGTYGDLNHIKSVAMHFFLLSSYKADFSVKLYCYFSSLEIENEKSYYETITTARLSWYMPDQLSQGISRNVMLVFIS